MDKYNYSETVIEHFRNPKNIGMMESPDGVALVGDPSCGDSMKLFIKVEEGVIIDATFLVFGCTAAIASSSITTEIIKGKTLEEATNISNQDIVKALGGLPKEKIHCSIMAEEAIKKAIDDYHYKEAAIYSGQDHTYPYLFNCDKCFCGNSNKEV